MHRSIITLGLYIAQATLAIVAGCYAIALMAAAGSILQTAFTAGIFDAIAKVETIDAASWALIIGGAIVYIGLCGSAAFGLSRVIAKRERRAPGILGERDHTTNRLRVLSRSCASRVSRLTVAVIGRKPVA